MITTSTNRGRGRTILRTDMHRGMRKGFSQVAIGDYWDLRDALLDIFDGCRSKMSRSITGKRIIHPDETKRIEDLFGVYGITEVWDE